MLGNGEIKNIAGCFIDGTVVSELQETEKYRAIHELIQRAPAFRTIEDIKEFENAVITREKIRSTALGHGVALAHGKSRVVKKFFIALGRSRRGIDFGAPDGQPVNFLFLVATPLNWEREYLSAVSALSGLLRDGNFRERLLAIKSSEKLEEVLSSAYSHSLACRV